VRFAHKKHPTYRPSLDARLEVVMASSTAQGPDIMSNHAALIATIDAAWEDRAAITAATTGDIRNGVA
jgi:hypothetical protein